MLVPPFLYLFAILLLVCAHFYAPTLIDADAFYQRIILDRLAMGGFFLLWLGHPLIVVGVCLSAYTLGWIGRRLETRGQLAWTVWRRVLLGIGMMAILVLVLQDYREYTTERASAESRLNELAMGLSSSVVARLREGVMFVAPVAKPYANLYERPVFNAALNNEFDALLSRVRLEPGQQAFIFLPVDAQYVFLMAVGSWHYADLRPREHMNAHSHITNVLAPGTHFTRNPLVHPCRVHVEGRALQTGTGELMAVLLIEYQREYRPSMLRKLCRAVWWGD